MKPNTITTLRLLLLPVIILVDQLQSYYLALFLIILAFFTDYLDGYISRKYNKVTTVGVFYDHFVDKIFVHGLLLLYLSQSLLPFYIVALLLLRDYLALGFRHYAISKQVVVASVMSGKIKLGLQGLLIILISVGKFHSISENMTFIFAIVVVIWSFYSLIDLLIKNKKIVEDIPNTFKPYRVTCVILKKTK